MNLLRNTKTLLSVVCLSASVVSALPVVVTAAPSQKPLVSIQTAQQPSTQFVDVLPSDWFHIYVTLACQSGLMGGTGDGYFSPGENLTRAQALVLAYQLHSQGKGTLPSTGGAWYDPYYQYALKNGIVTPDQELTKDLNAPASRYEMVSILDKAVPSTRLQAVNEVVDGTIPDVSEKDPNGAVVYKWYRAGILSGDHSLRFHGETNITRAETSVILCQLQGLTPPAKIADPLQAKVEEVVRLVNEERAKVGLAPVTLSQELTEAAMVRAAELPQLFSHNRPDGRDFSTALPPDLFFLFAGENIAYGFPTPERVMEGWMDSEGHRANILYPSANKIGVGYFEGDYWAQIFVAE